MSPELEQLLEALYEKLNCPPEEEITRAATFNSLVSHALETHPGTTRDELIQALSDRYREFVRARRKPPTIPPKA